MSHPLFPLFSFKSIAVVGASESSSFGSGPYKALQDVGFQGAYYPVNPRRSEVHGVKAYPDPSQIPEAIGAAAIVVGRERVLGAVKACVARGARAFAIISAGFVEADAEGARLQQELTEYVRQEGLLLAGPNGFGVASVVNRCAAFTGSGLNQSRAGNVGVVSSSGGLLNEVISYGNARRLGFSHLASLGNEAGVTNADVLDFFVDDPNTDVVLMVAETIRDPARFQEAARRAQAARKPIAVLKIGASEKAAQATLTHTGALAGSDAVYDALFKQLNVTRVADIDELIEVGALFSGSVDVLRRRPVERAAVIEISGGGKGLVCDTAAAAGVDLPDLAPQTSAALRAVLPDNVEPSNPLDTGGASWSAPEMAQLYPAVLDALAAQPDLDVIVSRFTVPRAGGIESIAPRLEEMKAARARHPDRLFAVLSRTSDQFSPAWGDAIAADNLVFLQGYGKGPRALGYLAHYSRRLRRPSAEAASTVQATPAPLPRRDRAVLSEVDAKDYLRARGLPVVPTAAAQTRDQAVQLAAQYGFPVALKVLSPQIVHKSDVGGVYLRLPDAEAVGTAFDALEGLVARTPGAAFEGVAVQPMAEPGLELVIGGHRDPQLGPVVLFGLGGIFVEALGDVALRLAPLAAADADEMLDEIRGRALLQGLRGQPPVDRAALRDALLRLGQVLHDTPEIASIDLNPVFAYPSGILAVDARIELVGAAVPAH